MKADKLIKIGIAAAAAVAVFLAILWSVVFKGTVREDNDPKTTFIVKEEESFYNDFKIVKNKVYIYCNLTIANRTEQKMEKTPYIILKQDKKNGLLKDEKLYALGKDDKPVTIELGSGEKISQEFCFVGEYGGNPQKANRLLPPVRFE